MKLSGIIAVCNANGVRSPAMEAFTRQRIQDLKLDIAVSSKGVRADFWNRVFADEEPMPIEYVDDAINRVVFNNLGYSENIANMIREGADGREIARAVFCEERMIYKLFLQRFCDEYGVEYPQFYHCQLGQEEIIDDTHLLVASPKVDEVLMGEFEVSAGNKTVLDVRDVLGGNYQQRKELLLELRDQVCDVLPGILEQYEVK